MVTYIFSFWFKLQQTQSEKTSTVSLIMKVFFCFSPSFPFPPFLLSYFLFSLLPSPIVTNLSYSKYCGLCTIVHGIKIKETQTSMSFFVLYLCYLNQDCCKEGMTEIIWRKQFKISKQGSNNTFIYLVSLYLFGVNQYLTR